LTGTGLVTDSVYVLQRRDSEKTHETPGTQAGILDDPYTK